MVEPIDIFRTANLMVSKYGKQAIGKAEENIALFEGKGDRAVAAAWMDIRDAIEHRQRTQDNRP